MAEIPTQRVRRIAVGDVVVINAADFDSAQHEAMSAQELAAYQPPAPAAAAPTVASTNAPEAPVDVDLLQNGPTLEEFVEAGYSQELYPPDGYAAKETPGLAGYRSLVASVVEVNAEVATSLVEAAETERGLDRFEAAERAHPKHEGGRVSVIRAIGERRAALKAKE